MPWPRSPSSSYSGFCCTALGAVVVAAGQAVGVLVLLTVQFSNNGLLGVLPGPAALQEFGALLSGAGQQIDTGIAPVPSTPQILFLVTAAFGLLAIGVHLAAVSAAAPAAAGVPLLAVFAVPAALADTLLPWWAMAAAAAGFGLLLVAHTGFRGRAARAPSRWSRWRGGAGASASARRRASSAPRAGSTAAPVRAGRAAPSASAPSPHCAGNSTSATPSSSSGSAASPAPPTCGR